MNAGTHKSQTCQVTQVWSCRGCWAAWCNCWLLNWSLLQQKSCSLSRSHLWPHPYLTQHTVSPSVTINFSVHLHSCPWNGEKHPEQSPSFFSGSIHAATPLHAKVLAATASFIPLKGTTGVVTTPTSSTHSAVTRYSLPQTALSLPTTADGSPLSSCSHSFSFKLPFKSPCSGITSGSVFCYMQRAPSTYSGWHTEETKARLGKERSCLTRDLG